MTEPRRSLLARLDLPRDPAGLVAFRVLFGALVCFASLRFVSNGWVEEFYLRPTFAFKYWGFEWATTPPAPWLYGLFAVMAVAGALIALGLFYRIAAWSFFLAFTYVELLDVAMYLNHYYLVSLLALLLCVLPLHRAGSLDARLRPSLRVASLPAWMTYLLRFQVGVVYVFAAWAKVRPDWLIHGDPLALWLASRTDTPVIGPLLDLPFVALVMSWAGFLYDASIVPLLAWRRSRPLAYGLVLVFHLFTHVFFSIGLFPLIMVVSTTVFFEADWPTRLGARLRHLVRAAGTARADAGPAPQAPRQLSIADRPLALSILAVYCTAHLLLPIRSLGYGGDVNWHEQGMRWAWKVMVREKNGSVTFRVRASEGGREQHVYPHRYLTGHQEREMAGQPDLILQLAQHIARERRLAGQPEVQVRADAFVSLNGRSPARLIDPNVDLAATADGVAPAAWILAAPAEPPFTPRPRSFPIRSLLARVTLGAP